RLTGLAADSPSGASAFLRVVVRFALGFGFASDTSIGPGTNASWFSSLMNEISLLSESEISLNGLVWIQSSWRFDGSSRPRAGGKWGMSDRDLRMLDVVETNAYLLPQKI